MKTYTINAVGLAILLLLFLFPVESVRIFSKISIKGVSFNAVL